MNKKKFSIIWKKISNDSKRKPTFTMDSYGRKIKNKGFIYPEHHIIYNIIRGYPLTRGFKLESEGFKNALNNLSSYANRLNYKSNFNISDSIFVPFHDLIDFEIFKQFLLENKELFR